MSQESAKPSVHVLGHLDMGSVTMPVSANVNFASEGSSQLNCPQVRQDNSATSVRQTIGDPQCEAIWGSIVAPPSPEARRVTQGRGKGERFKNDCHRDSHESGDSSLRSQRRERAPTTGARRNLSKPFRCCESGCFRSYVDQRGLNRHMKEHHSLEVGYVCEYCSSDAPVSVRKAVRRYRFKNHLSQYHRFTKASFVESAIIAAEKAGQNVGETN
ncbi:hypothetical protein BC834DRAFT_894268 [Gloeopeniophorella convolvens]|nr:hypothetical protein BC834DRAFT_894268 [Gloeopeniophorella convolvens]